jgi:hypothetical protein
MADEIMQFSWSRCIAGLIVAIMAGAVLSVGGGIVGAATRNGFLGALIGAAPSALLAVVSRRANQNGFGQGLLVGACVMAAVGGLCGGVAGGLGSN